MRRIMLLVTVALVMAAMMVAMAGWAYATPVQGPNPGKPNAAKSENCVGRNSAAITGNGASVREEGQSGTRDEIVQGNLASQGDCP